MQMEGQMLTGRQTCCKAPYRLLLLLQSWEWLPTAVLQRLREVGGCTWGLEGGCEGCGLVRGRLQEEVGSGRTTACLQQSSTTASCSQQPTPIRQSRQTGLATPSSSYRLEAKSDRVTRTRMLLLTCCSIFRQDSCRGIELFTSTNHIRI